MDEVMRDRFMELVYDLLKDDDSNQRANAIINCADEYAESMKQQWIPVTERLPQEGEVVLTQAKFKDDVKMAVSSRIDYNYWTTWGTRDINIIAWMPLPEPYKGE